MMVFVTKKRAKTPTEQEEINMKRMADHVARFSEVSPSLCSAQWDLTLHVLAILLLDTFFQSQSRAISRNAKLTVQFHYVMDQRNFLNSRIISP